MKLLLTSIIFTHTILIVFVSGDCEDDWTSMADENGVSIGFKLFKRDYKINYYHVGLLKFSGNLVRRQQRTGQRYAPH